MLVSSTALAGWDREVYISTSTTSVSTPELRQGNKFIVCTVNSFIRMGQVGVRADASDIPVAALERFPFIVGTTYHYVAAVVASGTGRCDVWLTDSGGQEPSPRSGVTQSVTGPVTDAELRALPLPISGVVSTQPLGIQTIEGWGGGTPVKVDGSATTQPVSGTFFQATQPVSLASAPTTAVTGTFWQATQPVSGTVTALPSGTQAVSLASAPTTPVTGTFWQGTQPVSLASAPTTPVTGTFWQATQPVSGTVTANAGSGTQAVSIASMPSTPVTGTFWQATQPVSGTVTANAGSGTQAVSIASMPSTPVTGTFYQATQPVSLAAAPTTPVTGTFWQATQPVSGTVAVSSAPTTAVTGTFFQATQPVSIASMPSTPVIGTFYQTTQPVSGTITTQSVDQTGTAHTIAIDSNGVQWTRPLPISPLNPLLQRCNKVRTVQCQP